VVGPHACTSSSSSPSAATGSRPRSSPRSDVALSPGPPTTPERVRQRCSFVQLSVQNGVRFASWDDTRPIQTSASEPVTAACMSRISMSVTGELERSGKAGTVPVWSADHATFWPAIATLSSIRSGLRWLPRQLTLLNYLRPTLIPFLPLFLLRATLDRPTGRLSSPAVSGAGCWPPRLARCS
jgi:hypothetical protein